MSDTIGSTDNSASGKCPVDFKTRSLWGLWGENGMSANGKSDPTSGITKSTPTAAAIPASVEEAARHAQTPRPDQRLPLSTHRLSSTIPRSGAKDTAAPAHQIKVDDTNNSKDNNWVYPSEQQVFNAMKRKGWKGIEEESIPSFLQIHNSVNERSWKEVLRWEEETLGIDSGDVELSRFEGRPTDLTPKAWLLSSLGLREKPFDRHDWYIKSTNTTENDNAEPTEKRYVLDFYYSEESGIGGVPRVEIDIRPALDGPVAVVQRGAGLLREAFPGLAREFDGLLQRQR